MLILTLKIFLPLLVARGVLCLTCYQTDTIKCQHKEVDDFLFYCFDWQGFEECESPKMCLEGIVKAPQVGTGWRYEAPLRGCALTQDCVKLLHELLDPYIPMVTPNLTVERCLSCSGPDLCNDYANKPRYNKGYKAMKMSKNSTTSTAPSARKRVEVVEIILESIFLRILLLLFSYF